MNWGQAALAAGAGLISIAVFLGGGLAAMRLSFTQFGLMPFGGGQTLNPIVALLGLLAVVVVVALALALPALAIGAGWRWSLLAAVLSGILFLFLVVLVVFPTPYKIIWLSLFIVAIPALIASTAVFGTSPEEGHTPVALLWVTAAVFFVASALLLLTFPQSPAIGLIVTLASWPTVPAIAVLLRSS